MFRSTEKRLSWCKLSAFIRDDVSRKDAKAAKKLIVLFVSLRLCVKLYFNLKEHRH